MSNVGIFFESPKRMVFIFLFCIFATVIQSIKVMHKTMEYPIEDIMEDAVFIVRKFAQQFSLNLCDAFNYLDKYQGLAFLQKHYGYEHTQPAYRTIEAMVEICRKNGGAL